MNISTKVILSTIHKDAYEYYKKCNNLEKTLSHFYNTNFDDDNFENDTDKKKTIVKSIVKKRKKNTQVVLTNNNNNNNNNDEIQPFFPIKPMLAKPSKSCEDIINDIEKYEKKLNINNNNSFYVEIKYDGERIQIHKNNDTIQCFSRNLKPLTSWKLEEIQDSIENCLNNKKSKKIENIILDGEILLIDHFTHKPLPFGSLAIHKKNDYQNANVCIFLFDILFINDQSLLNYPLNERREILEKNVKQIPDKIEFSELNEIDNSIQLNELMTNAINNSQEGLMIKSKFSLYKPGLRHWLKLKKDYLEGMADSADLYVLGCYLGNGNKTNIKNTFLMGCYDEDEKVFKTVTKVSGGLSDELLIEIDQTIPFQKINVNKSNVPNWLDVTKSLIPDFVILDNPKKNCFVWEIIGNQFEIDSKSHTSGISIRFPRVLKFRNDKSFGDGSNLNYLYTIAQSSFHNNVGEEENYEETKRTTKKQKKIDKNTLLKNILNNKY